MTVSDGKVLVLYYSSSRVCGVGTWVEMLSRELGKLQWDVTVGLAWGRKFHDPGMIESFRPGLKTVWMDGRTGTEEGRIRAIERTIRTVSPDIVILTCLDAAFEAVRRLKYRGMNFRFITINHGNLPGQAACLLEHRDVTDMIVCISKLSFDVMGRHADGYDPRRLRHIPNAVTLPSALSEKNGGVLRVGYAGRLDDDKRISDIVPFYRTLQTLSPSVELWVAGSGTREGVIESVSREFPGRVKYFGGLSQKKLFEEFYPNIDVIVNFSTSEAWGYSIAEAMAYGVVPVISEHRGVHSGGLFKDGESGLLFPVSDIVRAAELVNRLLSDRSRLVAVRRAAATYASKNFSAERFSRAWREALEECLKLPPLPQSKRPRSLDKKGRFGLREGLLEDVRRLLKRRAPHASPGEEWPHFVCGDATMLEEMKTAMESKRTEK